MHTESKPEPVVEKRIPLVPPAETTARKVKRIVKTIIGFTLIGFGIATGWMPIFQFWIPMLLGLAILATEYKWAKEWLHKVKEFKDRAMEKVRSRKNKKSLDKECE